MGLGVETKEDLKVIQAVDSCIRPLTAIRGLVERGMDSDSFIYPMIASYIKQSRNLNDVLGADKRFGAPYVLRLGHDVSAAYIGGVQLTFRRGNKANYLACVTLVEGLSEMIGSIADEIRPVFSEVDLGRVVDNVIGFTQAVDQVLPRIGSPRVEIVSGLEWNDLKNKGSRRILSRLLRNLVNNSRKSVIASLRGRESESGGWVSIEAEQTKNRTQVVITDNGVGFSSYLEMLEIDTSEEQISISDVVAKGNGITGFFQFGEGGTGYGLSIVERMARSLDGQVVITNPRYLDKGSRITVDLPTA